MRLTPEERERLRKVLDLVEEGPHLARQRLDALDASMRRGKRMQEKYGHEWQYVPELWKEFEDAGFDSKRGTEDSHRDHAG